MFAAKAVSSHSIDSTLNFPHKSHNTGTLKVVLPQKLNETSTHLKNIATDQTKYDEARKLFRPASTFKCPINPEKFLDKITEARENQQPKSLLFLPWWDAGEGKDDQFIEELCDTQAAAFFRKKQNFEPQHILTVEALAHEILVNVQKELSSNKDILYDPDKLRSLAMKSAKIAMEVYYFRVECKAMNAYIRSMIKERQYDCFLKGEKWSINKMKEARAYIQAELKKLPFFHKMDRYVLDKNISTLLSTNDYGFIISSEGGRFQSCKTEIEQNRYGLAATQVKTDDGEIFELLNTLQDDQLPGILASTDLSVEAGKTVLGQGTYGKVRLARRVCDETVFAVKKMYSSHDALIEIKQHRMIGQDPLLSTASHIAQIRTKNKAGKVMYKAYLFMPLSNDGNGRDALIKLKNEREHQQSNIDDQLRHIACSYLKSLNALHSKDFVHRDIKPDNFLHCKNGHITLADFGFAEKGGDPKNYRYKEAGTPGYLPPELKLYSYDGFKHDAFSLGMTLLEIKLGCRPINSNSTHLQLPDGDYRLKFDLAGQSYGVLLDETARAKLTYNTLDEIIAGLLDRNPEKRLTPKEALEKPYFKIKT